MSGMNVEPTAATSLFQSSLPLEQKLERARLELLDLSARNRLLNMPRSARTVRSIEVVDEKSAEVFRLLVREGRSFTFVPGRAAGGGESGQTDESEEIQALAQPEDDSVDSRGVLNRHADTKLQTRLTSAGLQKRLLDLYTDARTLEEEQGVNILFLTLGSLKWIDPVNKENIRYAPLILVPVSLERGTAAERFKLKSRQEDVSANLSLESFLDRSHGLKLPTFDPGEEFDPVKYMTDVASVISTKPGWAVIPDDIVLGFFSFAKFLMYRDLDPEIWPAEGKLTDLPLVRGLLADGFPAGSELIGEDARIDSLIPPAELRHIVDADSSQAVAIHEVRAGRSLVIQGPPGTGKSQTIANVIAAAIADGKTVLFVAEKMAALEVVKRRLDQAGVGDACLELHSNKASKRLILDEIRRTWELGSPRGDFGDSVIQKLQEARDRLNSHAERMHRRHSPSGLTTYQVIGELVRLRDEGQVPVDFQLDEPETWTQDERVEREKLLTELIQRLSDIGRPAEHAWWGVGLVSVLPTQVERFVGRIETIRAKLQTVVSEQSSVAHVLECPAPTSLGSFTPIAAVACRIATAPSGMDACLGVAEWGTQHDSILALLDSGERRQRAFSALSGKVTEGGWRSDTRKVRQVMASLPADFDQPSFERTRRLNVLLPQLQEALSRLHSCLGLSGTANTPESLARMLQIGQHVCAAPAVNPEAFTAAVWDYGLEQAADLVQAVSDLESARNSVSGKVSESAWNADCSGLRQTLAAHGTSWFRFLNGEWRTANRLVKSILTAPPLSNGEVLAVLETLAKGQRALTTVRNGDALGRSAFGLHWRGERSSAAELRALLEWVRGLGPLGREVRSIASQPVDREALGAAVACLRLIWDESCPLIGELAVRIGGELQVLFDVVLQRCAEVVAADDACSNLLTHPQVSAGVRAEILSQLDQFQDADRRMEAGSSLGAACFRSIWQGPNSNWDALRTAASWVAANSDIRLLASRVEDRGGIASRSAAIEESTTSLCAELEKLLDDLHLDRLLVFGTGEVLQANTVLLGTRLERWLAESEGLSKWVAFKERAERARGMGMRTIVDRLSEGRIVQNAVSVFRRAYFEALLEEQVRQDPELSRFDGHLHAKLVQEFRDLDQQRIGAARLEVVRAHHRQIPPTGGLGPVGVLRAEIAKKRGHLPIRQLITKAASAVQAIKPVMMMSPLSVAQFLPPGLLTFDLLVMDEASQIQPVDAMGAIARCRQVVVVGDERQLPPTKFFSKMTGGQPDDDDAETAQVADIESILGLFIARGMPQRMLRWHYRSRHQSLIAVSNSQFYENKLFIVPSPYTAEAGRGLHFHHVRDGRFDSGNSRTNSIEARVVAEAVIRHAREYPHRSLGVAAFSASQMRAIRDQIEILRRANQDTEAFFHAHPAEPFFVKNLENIQGDERDVIFISVGYGKNAQGYMAMAFGPLSSEGGERRLNVLISRAKLRCEVFSSITDEDIDTERGKGKGVFAFKLFLHYARTGRLSMAQATGRDHDSVFEVQVANALIERGYNVVPQVGIAGFFIDLAISDPEQPGRYILGIECDGAAYHSARWARDRDRLRQSVLEDHGWTIYRIWSTDWFQRPKEQLDLLVKAIEAAKAERTQDSESADRSKAVHLELVSVDRGDVTEIGWAEVPNVAADSVPYQEVSLNRPAGWPELTETPSYVLADLVSEAAQVEGPVHVDEIVVRIRSAWDLQRSGNRIQAAVENALAHAVTTRDLVMCESFVWKRGSDIRVRDRSAVSSTSLRKPEMLPPQEIKEGVLQIVKSSLGATEDEVVQALSRRLGFRSTSSQLRELIQRGISTLISEGLLTRDGLYLKLCESENGGRLS